MEQKRINSKNLTCNSSIFSLTGESIEINFKYSKQVFVCIWNVGIFIFCFGSILGVLYLLSHLTKEVFGDWAGAFFVFLILLSFVLFWIVSFLLTARITERLGTAIFRETETEIILNKRKVSIPYCVITSISYVKTTSGDIASLLAGKLRIDFSDSKNLTIHSSEWEAWKEKWKYGLWWIIRSGQYLPDMSLKQVYDEIRRRTGICGFYSEIEEIANG